MLGSLVPVICCALGFICIRGGCPRGLLCLSWGMFFVLLLLNISFLVHLLLDEVRCNHFGMWCIWEVCELSPSLL